MGVDLVELLQISPPIAEFAVWTGAAFEHEARISDRFRNIGARLPDSLGGAEEELRRLRVAIVGTQAVIAPLLPDLYAFMERFGDTKPRSRKIELPLGGFREEPITDLEVVKAAWAARRGYEYVNPDLSMASACYKMANGFVTYKGVKHDRTLQGVAQRASDACSAVGSIVMAAEGRSIGGACAAFMWAMRSAGDSRSAHFEAALSILEEMF